MFIDYLALMLLNLTAGLFLLGAYMAWGLCCGEDRRLWSPAFGAVGLVALLTGLHMTFTWPLPGPFNMAFGEMSVLFGAAYLAAAVAVGLGWSLVGVAVYGAIGGLGAVVVGIRILHLHLISHIHLTAMPALTAAGYILVGISALLVLGALASKAAKGLRILAAVLLFLSAGLWGFNAYGAYWMHFEAQKDWKPATMHAAAAQPASALAAEAAK